jgi:hypothetical protein
MVDQRTASVLDLMVVIFAFDVVGKLVANALRFFSRLKRYNVHSPPAFAVLWSRAGVFYIYIRLI